MYQILAYVLLVIGATLITEAADRATPDDPPDVFGITGWSFVILVPLSICISVYSFVMVILLGSSLLP